VNLSETGESRVNGYLFVLERSLKTFLPAGFFAALGLLAAYLGSIAFVALAFLKPIFPNNVGIWVHDATPGEWSFTSEPVFPGSATNTSPAATG
jgi:hypothetical protein